MRRLARPLMYAGVVGIVFGLSKYHAASVGGYDLTASSRFAWAIAYVGFSCVAAYGLGLPEVPRTARSRLPTAILAAIVAALGISAVQLVVGDRLLPRFVVFGSALLLVPWYYVLSALSGAGRRSLEQRDRAVIVGSDALREELTADLDAAPERPAVLHASLTEAEAAETDGKSRPLVEAVLAHRATVVILSAEAQRDERIVDQAATLHEAGVRVRTVSLFYEEWLGKLPVTELGRVALFFDIGEIHRERYGRFKRLIDLVAGMVGLCVLLIAIPLVVIGDLIANRGPVFYVQERVGRDGRCFRIFKFRTMRDDARMPTDWTGEDDPRVTPFGGLLRVSHLDELPQVWNILRGDLSLVGPRPEQPRYVDELSLKLPYYDLRHIVRPGLTGWAQVKYGYASDERGALEKLQYDFHYLRRQSLLFDLRIIGRTVRSVLGRAGR